MVFPRVSHPILSRLAHVQKNDGLRTSSWSFCSFILALFTFSLETSAVIRTEFTGNPWDEKKPWANEPPKAKDILRELLEEHVILTRCSNGLIYYGNRHRKPLFLASKIKLTLQERPWRHLQECPWRQFWALQIDKIGMSRGNCSSSSRGTFFLLSCGAP